MVDHGLLETLRLAPLYVQSLSIDDEFVERLLRGGFGSGSRRVLNERTLLARHDRQIPHLTVLVEVVPTHGNVNMSPYW